MIEDSVIAMMEKVELNGYHSSWLAPDSPASRTEVEADRVTYEAGLGSTIEEIEKPVFIATVRRIREQMRPLGINLPPFPHSKLRTSEMQGAAGQAALPPLRLLVERRFPLEMNVTLPQIRELYDTGKAGR